MNYDIKVAQDTGEMIAVIYEDNNNIAFISEQVFAKRVDIARWVAGKLAELNPEGPCYMTRKKVYNERVSGKPGFWEICTYNAKGVKLRTAQYRDIMPEGYLRGLVQNQLGFPLEAAEEIK